MCRLNVDFTAAVNTVAATKAWEGTGGWGEDAECRGASGEEE